MRIIKSTPSEDGAYEAIQEGWPGDTPPEGYSQVSVGVTLSCGGFGTLTGIGNVVTSFTPDEAKWTAWQAAHPVPAPTPTETEKLRADVDYIAVMANVDLGEV